MADGLIDHDDMGDVWPAVHPGRAPGEYGAARVGAVRGVSFDVAEGERYGIVGGSG